MGEQSKAMEDKVAQLMESYAASKTSWDKEVEEKLCCERRQCDDSSTYLQCPSGWTLL